MSVAGWVAVVGILLTSIELVVEYNGRDDDGDVEVNEDVEDVLNSVARMMVTRAMSR